MIAIALALLDIASPHRCDLVEDSPAPDVSILHVVKTFVAGPHKVVDVDNAANLVLRSPVGCNLHLSSLRIRVLLHTVESNQEGHVAAVLAVETHALYVCLGNRARPHRGWHLVVWHDACNSDVVLSWEVVTGVDFQCLVI